MSIYPSDAREIRDALKEISQTLAKLVPAPKDTGGVDHVYRERNRLVAFLAQVYPAVLWREDADWSVVYISTPAGQLSWHIGNADLNLFEIVPWHETCVWDGHDTDEKYRRLQVLTGRW